MKRLTLLLVAFIPLASISQRPQPRSGDSVAMRSFNELLKTHDKGLMDAIASKHAYVCFRKNSDEFLIASYTEPSADWWTPLKDDPDHEIWISIAKLDDYKNGAIDPHGVSLFTSGSWSRRKDMPDLATYRGNSPKSSDKTDAVDDSIVIDNAEYRLSETYENFNGNSVKYLLTIRLSTGRYLESFETTETFGRPLVTETSGSCQLYSRGKRAVQVSQ